MSRNQRIRYMLSSIGIEDRCMWPCNGKTFIEWHSSMQPVVSSKMCSGTQRLKFAGKRMRNNAVNKRPGRVVFGSARASTKYAKA